MSSQPLLDWVVQLIKQTLNLHSNPQGRNWVILRGGRRYNYNRKDEIIHGLSPSVKCVSPLFRDISLIKCKCRKGAPPPVAPLLTQPGWKELGASETEQFELKIRDKFDSLLSGYWRYFLHIPSKADILSLRYAAFRWKRNFPMTWSVRVIIF